MKDLIISGGINISPVELEAAIGTLEGVEEVAVIAAATRASVKRQPPSSRSPPTANVDEAGVVAHCEWLLADYKVPRYVVLRSEPLPRLPSGKLDKRAIREEYHDIGERFARAR